MQAKPKKGTELSAREIEVLDLMCKGLSNKQIGAELGMSRDTAKFHVYNICGKIGGNRTFCAVEWTKVRLLEAWAKQLTAAERDVASALRTNNTNTNHQEGTNA